MTEPIKMSKERGAQVLDMGEMLVGMVERRSWKECSQWLASELEKAEQRGAESERRKVVEYMRSAGHYARTSGDIAAGKHLGGGDE